MAPANLTKVSVVVKHCEKKHQDMCDYLLAMSDTQLLEMARRLDACAKE